MMGNYIDLRKYSRTVESVHKKPHGGATLEKNVWVVFWHAIIPSAAISALSLVAYLFVLEWIEPIRLSRVVLGMFTTFLVSFLTKWKTGIDTSNKLLWSIEKVFGRDLDNDEQVGKPRKKIWVGRGNGQKKILLSATPTQFSAWKNAVLRNDDLTYEKWVRREKVFTETEYNSFLRSLAKEGLVEIGDNTSTAKLTPYGKANI